MAELSAIRNESADQISKTRKAGQETGANIVASTFRDTNADELREHLEGVKKQGAANIEAAKAAATEQAGTAQNQQGNGQVQMGQTLIAAASVAASSGLGAPAAMGMFAAGTALVLTGTGNKTQGEQKIEAAPPMIAKSSDLSNQSAGHFDKAEQIKSKKEEQANNEDSPDPDSPKETGKNKGYYVADSGNAGASTDTDNELVADRLTDAEKTINKKLGITTDSDTKEGSIATDDKTTIASRLNQITDNIGGLVDTKSDQTNGGTGTEATITNQLKERTGEVDDLLGVKKEKVG